MRGPAVKIVGKAPFGTEIFINGEKVEGVSSYSLSQNPGEMPILNLSIFADKLDIETPFLLKGEEAESFADEPTS